MLDLALSILFSSLIFVVFKLYDTYRIQTLYAIIINYIVASAVGMFFYEKKNRVAGNTCKTMVSGNFGFGNIVHTCI